MAEKIISERVISRKVIGSANPIAKKFRNLKGSFGGICIAPFLLIIALGIIYYGETFKKHSRVVENLTLESAEEVSSGASGLHKISGKPKDVSELISPYVGDEIGKVLYYSYAVQEYQEVEETEYETVTRIENGQEIEEEVERVKLVEKWVDEETSSKWAEFKLGNFSIEPSSANKELKFQSKEYYEDFEGFIDVTSKNINPEIGDYRITLSYLQIDIELIVIGEISGSSISGGETFIISNKSDSELLSDLKSGETTTYWVMKAGSWFMLTMGFMMLLSPVLSLLDFIPIAGKAASCAASVVGAIFAFIIVVTATIIIKFWWAFLILAVLGIIGVIVLIVMLAAKKNDKKGTDSEEDNSKNENKEDKENEEDKEGKEDEKDKEEKK